MIEKSSQNQLHTPVLLDEVLSVLNPKQGESYLDVTAGYGGHAAAVFAQTSSPDKATLVDRDHNAIAVLSERFSDQPQLLQSDFLTASQQLADSGARFDMILADLGVSSPHLNHADRGFAISADGPLDMRMDQSQALTAATICNTYSEARLHQLLKVYGEEPKAARIAQLIVQARPLSSTHELAELVKQAWPGHSRVHPATRTFQALRIEVNNEIELLKQSLPIWLSVLAPGGRLAIISFHSLEDRLVKQFFAERGGERYDAELHIQTKRPITASAKESVFNPRARSAKLRAAVKIKT